MKSERAWIYVFVILILLSRPCGVQSAMAASKAKSVSTKAPAQTSVIKESQPSQSAEKPEIFVQMSHISSVRTVTINQRGNLIASGGFDRTIKLWDVLTGKEIRTLVGHVGNIYSVAFSPDGSMLASGSSDKPIKIWNIENGRVMKNITTLLMEDT